MKSKIRILLTLCLYIFITVGIYYLIVFLMDKEFTELHLLYSVLIGCVAYLPLFLLKRKQNRYKQNRYKK